MFFWMQFPIPCLAFVRLTIYSQNFFIILSSLIHLSRLCSILIIYLFLLQYYNPTCLDNLEVTTPMLTTASTTIVSNITHSLVSKIIKNNFFTLEKRNLIRTSYCSQISRTMTKMELVVQKKLTNPTGNDLIFSQFLKTKKARISLFPI